MGLQLPERGENFVTFAMKLLFIASEVFWMNVFNVSVNVFDIDLLLTNGTARKCFVVFSMHSLNMVRPLPLGVKPKIAFLTLNFAAFEPV